MKTSAEIYKEKQLQLYLRQSEIEDEIKRVAREITVASDSDKIDRLLIAIERATGVTEQQLRERTKKGDRGLIRGCYYYAAKKLNVLSKSAYRIGRSHSTASITYRKFEGYLAMGDKQIMNIMNLIKTEYGKMETEQ